MKLHEEIKLNFEMAKYSDSSGKLKFKPLLRSLSNSFEDVVLPTKKSYVTAAD